MKHMMEAMKRKMMHMKGDKAIDVSGDEEDKNFDGGDGEGMEEREGTDLAPSLHGAEHGEMGEGEEAGHIDKMGQLLEGAEGEQEALHDQHRKILESLSDGGNMGQMGSGGGLRSRVASNARGKLMGMKK